MAEQDGAEAEAGGDANGTAARTFQKVEFATFESTMRELDLAGDILCYQIGYSAAVWKDWKAAGKMPKPAALACECLRRRKQNAKGQEVWLVKVQTEMQSAALEGLCRGMAIEWVKVND
jgi:hypothetical protein